MFDTLRTNTCTICDLNLAAYLLLMGMRLEGVAVQSKTRAAFTITGRGIPLHIHDYKTGKRIRFSPKAYMELRYDLKKLCPEPSEVEEMPIPKR